MSKRVKESLSHLNTYQYIKNLVRTNNALWKVFVTYNLMSNTPNFFEIFLPKYDKQILKAYEATYNNKLYIKELCERNKSNFILALASSPFQFDMNLLKEEYYRSNNTYYSKKRRPYNIKEISKNTLSKPNKFMLSFCNNNNIYCIDLIKEIKKSSNNPVDDYYFKSVDHWNAKGEMVVANILYRKLSYYFANNE